MYVHERFLRNYSTCLVIDVVAKFRTEARERERKNTTRSIKLINGRLVKGILSHSPLDAGTRKINIFPIELEFFGTAVISKKHLTRCARRYISIKSRDTNFCKRKKLFFFFCLRQQSLIYISRQETPCGEHNFLVPFITRFVFLFIVSFTFLSIYLIFFLESRFFFFHFVCFYGALDGRLNCESLRQATRINRVLLSQNSLVL